MRRSAATVLLNTAISLACTASNSSSVPEGTNSGGDSGSGGPAGAGGGNAGTGGSESGGRGGTTGGAGGSLTGGTGGGLRGPDAAAGSSGGAPRDASAVVAAGDAAGARDGAAQSGPRFSFFVTSIESMRELSGSQNGFGGNLGGIDGADMVCQKVAAKVGAGQKTWRAFMSATRGGPNGGPVHAIDRIGEGPWYDRAGRLIAMNKTGLLSSNRPAGDPQAVVDLPNERGEPLRKNGLTHDVLTGSNKMGRLASTDPASTCHDWTYAKAEGTAGKVYCGHSWPRNGSNDSMWWSSAHTVPGCAPGVNLSDQDMGGGCVGCFGGYGGIYCFALTP